MSDLNQTEKRTYEVLNNLHEQAPDLSIVYLRGKFSTLDVYFVDPESGKRIVIPGMLVAGDIYSHAKSYERWVAEQVFFSYPDADSSLPNFKKYLDRYLDSFEREPSGEIQKIKSLRHQLWLEFWNEVTLTGQAPKYKPGVKKSWKDLFYKNLDNRLTTWIEKKKTIRSSSE